MATGTGASSTTRSNRSTAARRVTEWVRTPRPKMLRTGASGSRSATKSGTRTSRSAPQSDCAFHPDPIFVTFPAYDCAYARSALFGAATLGEVPILLTVTVTENGDEPDTRS
jgi:hypothetical protein